jgi:hypothetical protein
MSGCEYCDRTAERECDACGNMCCPRCLETLRPGLSTEEHLCNPDSATHPGRGCYKPPVSEVSNEFDERR